MTDFVVLKNDVLNDLRNNKYFVQKELERIASLDNISHKNKVETVISLIGQIADLNTKMVLVDEIFVTPKPQPVSQQVPTNVVEAQAINQHGQSHSE